MLHQESIWHHWKTRSMVIFEKVPSWNNHNIFILEKVLSWKKCSVVIFEKKVPTWWESIPDEQLRETNLSNNFFVKNDLEKQNWCSKGYGSWLLPLQRQDKIYAQFACAQLAESPFILNALFVFTFPLFWKGSKVNYGDPGTGIQPENKQANLLEQS